MKKLLSLMFVVLFAGATMAPAASAERRALAEKLLDAMDMKLVIENTFGSVKESVAMQMATQSPPSASPKEIEAGTRTISKMMDLMSEAMSWDKLKDDYIALYAETFNEEELKALTAFYSSEAGRAYTAKQPELTRRSMEMSQRVIAKMMPQIQAIAEETVAEDDSQK
ncbi:MAG: DUF2059 domain-containing protein [Kiritimatiellae bacterium]|nr:DUF2059 domain-containing protein [Kiritimatiellia bacterium]